MQLNDTHTYTHPNPNAQAPLPNGRGEEAATVSPGSLCGFVASLILAFYREGERQRRRRRWQPPTAALLGDPAALQQELLVQQQQQQGEEEGGDWLHSLVVLGRGPADEEAADANHLQRGGTLRRLLDVWRYLEGRGLRLATPPPAAAAPVEGGGGGAAAAAGMGPPLTHEQRAVVQCRVGPGQLLRVRAAAGAGKTTVLRMWAWEHPPPEGKMVLYVVFTKAMQVRGCMYASASAVAGARGGNKGEAEVSTSG
jgi:hypothetical protein